MGAIVLFTVLIMMVMGSQIGIYFQHDDSLRDISRSHILYTGVLLETSYMYLPLVGNLEEAVSILSGL